jgi:hypothetical protein
MTDYEKAEFWNALGRLYDSSVALKVATEKLAEIATAHEKRIDRLDVIVEWLAEEERKRKKGE